MEGWPYLRVFFLYMAMPLGPRYVAIIDRVALIRGAGH
jgi:hypothetical protein